VQAFEQYMREHGLDTLDELYMAPTLSDTLYRHVALGAHLSDDLTDGDRLDALMVRPSLLWLLMWQWAGCRHGLMSSPCGRRRWCLRVAAGRVQVGVHGEQPGSAESESSQHHHCQRQGRQRCHSHHRRCAGAIQRACSGQTGQPLDPQHQPHTSPHSHHNATVTSQ
jgi:hypothetical protein